MSKLKAAVAIVLVLGFLGTGAAVLCCRPAAAQGEQPPAAEKKVKTPQKPEKEKEGFTAWGKEVGGLQAGLGFRPGEHRAYHYGETIKLVIRLRNVGKEEVKFSYLQPFIEHAPTVTDGEGKPVSQPDVIPDIGERLPGEVTLAPGKEIELHELKRELWPASESSSNRFSTTYRLYGTGKVSVQYEQVLGLPSMIYRGWKLDPALSKLATGKLELEIKPEPDESPEEKVKRRNLVELYDCKSSLTTTPTPQAPLPPVIYFFKGEKNEVRIAPGLAGLVELPNRSKEVTWQIPGYEPEAIGDKDGPPFDYVLCRWHKDGNVVFTLLRKP